MIEDFTPKCQVEVIRTFNPEFEILIVTHFKNKLDIEIKVHEPVSFTELLNKFEEILKNEKWDQYLPDYSIQKLYKPSDYQKKYKHTLENKLINIYQDPNKQFDMNSMENNIIQKSLIFPPELFPPGEEIKDFIWIISGSLVKIDYKELTNKIIDNSRAYFKEDANSKTQEPVRPIGYMTYFFPPIWLDDFPAFTEKAQRSKKSYHIRQVITNYKNDQLIIYKDGKIGIIQADISEAISKLNEIMAVCTFMGYPFFAVREIDLEKRDFYPDTLQEAGHFGDNSLSTRSILKDDREDWSKAELPLSWRTQISSNKLRELIEFSEKIENQSLLESLQIYLQAYTHYQLKEYVPSFIISWVIIEKHLHEKWIEFLKQKSIGGRREKILTDSSNWTISNIIEVLNLFNIIDNNEYEQYTKLRRKRNKLLHPDINKKPEHKLNLISREDAKSCLLESNNILTTELEIILN